MRPWFAALLVLAGCVGPPATPEMCRENISIAYGQEALLQLAHETREFEWRVRRAPYERVQLFDVVTALYLRDRTIEQCVAHHWPSPVARCYRDAQPFEDCARRLPHHDCVALEHAVDIHERVHPRLCAER